MLELNGPAELANKTEQKWWSKVGRLCREPIGSSDGVGTDVFREESLKYVYGTVSCRETGIYLPIRMK